MSTGLIHAHRALGWLFVVSTTASLLLAVLVLMTGPKPGLLRAGKVLLRFVETSLLGLLGLTGVALWASDGPPIATWWTWVGAGAVVAASLVATRRVRPAIDRAATSDQARHQWPAWAGLHWVIAIAAFGIMYAM